jgi:hypothetical protein
VQRVQRQQVWAPLQQPVVQQVQVQQVQVQQVQVQQVQVQVSAQKEQPRASVKVQREQREQRVQRE